MKILTILETMRDLETGQVFVTPFVVKEPQEPQFLDFENKQPLCRAFLYFW
jgi:hypothetical protein